MTVTSRRVTTRQRRFAVLLIALVTALGIAGGAVATAPVDNRPPGQRNDRTRLTRAQRTVLWEATHRFRSVDAAVAAGYVPTDECVPGMGFHYGNPELVGDANIDPTLPDVLVYAPARDGSVRLAALEYFRADADGDKGTNDDRPTLFGHPFDGPMDGHAVPPGAPPMPVHYDLHVWLHESNPAGELSPENPDVRCPDQDPS